MDSFSPANPRLITLTTDFGLTDPFVGTMEGVIAGICPAARVIDLTHGVSAFQIEEGAIKLWQAARYFPAETIHVAVVDPGVGSARRAVVLHAGSQWFVAPDNGLLSWILADATGPVAAWQLENTEWFLPGVSHTFHGRDIFAPIAAHLCNAVEPAEFGRALDPTSLALLPGVRPVIDGGIVVGRVVLIDKFGNLLTNIRAAQVAASSRISVAGRVMPELLENYSAGKPDEPFAILGSSGLLEIAVTQGSAAALLNSKINDEIRIEPRKD